MRCLLRPCGDSAKRRVDQLGALAIVEQPLGQTQQFVAELVVLFGRIAAHVAGVEQRH